MKRKSASRYLGFLAIPELRNESTNELMEPVYVVIAAKIRKLIFSQKIVSGDSLPSLRTVASKLSVSVDTVRRAYFLLIDEGIIESKTGSGFKVVSPPPKDDRPIYPKEGAALNRKKPKQTESVVLCSKALTYFRPDHYRTRPFLYFGETIELGKDREWNSIVSRLNRMIWHHASYSDPQGSVQLRMAIAKTLLRNRGIEAEAENIVITTGTVQNLNLLSSVLLSPGDSIVLEQPSPNLVPDVFSFNKIEASFIPVLSDGLDVGKLAEYEDCQALFTVSSNQIPMSVCTSLEKRKQILTWAQQKGKWIFENGMEDLFWHGNRIPAITALDSLEGNTVFMDSFTLLFFPGIRIGYIAAPREIAKAVAGAKLLLDRTTSTKGQDYLGQYMQSDSFEAYLRRLNKIFVQRRDLLRMLLKSELSEYGQVSESRCGCHLTFTFTKEGVSDKDVKKLLEKRGVTCRVLSEFPGGGEVNGLVLGFGLFQSEELKKAVSELKQVLKCFSA